MSQITAISKKKILKKAVIKTNVSIYSVNKIVQLKMKISLLNFGILGISSLKTAKT